MKKNIDPRMQKIGNFLARSRAKAGVSQEYMANEIGVARGTIIKWERGESLPDILQGFAWFSAINVNPIPYLLYYHSPDLFEDLFSNYESSSEKSVCRAFDELISQMSVIEKRQLLFLMAGEHGSDWHSMLQMYVADAHTSLRSRHNIAQQILNNYEIESEANVLNCPNNVKPDLRLLRSAVDKSREAIKDGLEHYQDKYMK